MLVGGLVAFGAYKMSTKDADRIKEHTGTDPEEMTDEELAQSMDELGIEKQQVTDADQEEGGGAPAAPEPAGQGGTEGGLGELEQLAKLHEEGILTDEEFTAKKKQILGL